MHEKPFLYQMVTRDFLIFEKPRLSLTRFTPSRMKFRLYAILIAASGALFAACDNGAYDAHPKFDGSNFQNPINPSLTAAKGTIKMRIDGQFYTFYNSRFSVQDSFLQVISIDTTIGEPRRIVEFAIRPYKGVRTYPLTDSNGTFYYAAAAYATLFGNDTTIYNTRWPAKKGEGEVKVELSNANEVKGTFKFTAYRERPADQSEKVVMTDGSFWATPQ